MTFSKEIKPTINLALPIIVSQLGVSLMGISDTIMIGFYLGKIALGISGISNSVAYLIACIAVGGFHVVSPLVSKANAVDDKDEIKYLYHASLRVVFGFSIVLTILMAMACIFFDVLQQPESVNEAAPPFLMVVALSFVPNYYFLGLKQILDGIGKPSIAMKITIGGLFFNILFNYIFINGVLFFPAMGILGAAISTLGVRIIMTLALYVAIRKYFDPKLDDLDHHKLKKLTTYIYKLTIPSGLALFFEVGAFTFTFVMMGWIGNTALAAHQVSLNFISVTYMISAGLSYAGSIRLGEARGLQDRSMMRHVGNATIFLIAVFMLISGSLILIFDQYLISWYIHETEVIDLSIKLLWIAGALTIFDGLQVAGLSLLRGLSDVNIPTAMTLVAYWLIALPLGYFLGFYLDFESTGIYLGLYAGLGASALMVLLRFYYLLPKTAF